MSVIISHYPRPARAYDSLTVTGSATPCDSADYNKALGDNNVGVRDIAKAAFVTVEDAEIRYSLVPGVTPTASTNGHLAGVNTYFWLYGRQIQDFQAIRTASTSAILRITYFF